MSSFTAIADTWVCSGRTAAPVAPAWGRKLMDARGEFFSGQAGCVAVDFDCSARAPLLLFIANLGYLETGTAPFAPTCLPRSPGTTSSCPKPFAEGRAVVMLNLHPFISNLRAFRQNTPFVLGGKMNRTAAIACILFVASRLGSIGITLPPTSSLSSATPPNFSGRAPVGKRSSRYSYPENLARILCRNFRRTAPRRLAR